MNKKILFAFLGACLLAGGFYYQQGNKIPDGNLILYGNIEIRQVDLSFQVGGKVDKMLKEEGDHIQAGETVALLDKKDYAANHRMAKAAVAQTLAICHDAQLKFRRNEQLLQQKAVSQQTFDTAKYAFEQAQANYEAAVAKAVYTQNQLDYTELTAPEAGIITVRSVEPGATVAATQSIYTLSKQEPVWIRAFVNEMDLGNIKYGMTAQILTDSHDPATGKPRIYQGHIGYISPVAEFTPKAVQTTDLRTNLVYRIRVYVDQTDDFLRQGMPTTIQIKLK